MFIEAAELAYARIIRYGSATLASALGSRELIMSPR